MTSKELAPLQNTLDSILSRLAQLENHAGVKPPVCVESSVESGSNASNEVGPSSIAPRLEAYQNHMDKAVIPFVEACNTLDGLKDIGLKIKTIWVSIQSIIELATKCKKPSDIQSSLTIYLKPIQDAIGQIRSVRLDRKFDWHIKAIMELLPCASWVIMTTPPAPCNFIKDTVGSSDFWSNKIRKEYKGKDEKQIAFCDTLKVLIIELSAYVKEYHLGGLMWNPRGIPVEQYEKSSETSTVAVSSSSRSSSRSPSSPRKTTIRPAPGNVMRELAARKTSEGNSAAAGLKSVSRDQQTWRKEYTGSSTKVPIATTRVKPSQIKAAQKTSNGMKLQSHAPVCMFKDSKWIVEYQTQTSNQNGVCVIEAKSTKEQIYIYKCENATIKVKGKVKSITMDSCFKSNLVFESAISSCEVVNCKKLQIQSTGICPSFAIDKTDGCLVFLSQEAVSISSFVTTKSSEMNVSWVDNESGEQQERPIPEQFVHRLVDGALTSDVSDLYH